WRQSAGFGESGIALAMLAAAFSLAAISASIRTNVAGVVEIALLAGDKMLEITARGFVPALAEEHSPDHDHHHHHRDRPQDDIHPSTDGGALQRADVGEIN